MYIEFSCINLSSNHVKSVTYENSSKNSKIYQWYYTYDGNSILYILNKPFKEIKKYIFMKIYVCLVETLSTV
jgi:hypothetical protein